MTPEAQRIAIAEACGWDSVFVDAAGALRGHKEGNVWILPDYLSDLNAMHEAEKVLTFKEKLIYVEHLARLAGSSGYDIYDGWAIDAVEVISTATAAQRNEAFGRTLNLW